MSIFRSSLAIFCFSPLLLLNNAPLHADPITYTMTGTATGVFSGTDFTNEALEIDVFGDTADLITQSNGNGGSSYTLDADSATVSINGFATANFTASPQMFLNGLWTFNIPSTVIIGGGSSSWNLISPIGPVAFNLFDLNIGGVTTTFNNIPTTEGNLTVTSLSNGEMTASVQSAVEPSSMSLFAIAGGLGMIGLGLRRYSTFDRSERSAT